MGLSRSAFSDASVTQLDEAGIIGRIRIICDEFESYSYRRVGAELRHQGKG
jgi:putative transposase